MLEGVFYFRLQGRKKSNMKAFESKQHIFITILWYCPGGDIPCDSMSSFSDSGFNCMSIILRMEGHML